MKQSLAVWHYPYRTPAENVRYFAREGFEALSLQGIFFLSTIRDPEARKELASALKDTGVTLTIHSILPTKHLGYDVERFEEDMRLVRDWYLETGNLENVSFDVYPDIRPGAGALCVKALEILKDTPIHVLTEDYGLTPEELTDLEQVRPYPNFGYLMDLGHLNVRLHHGNPGHVALQQHGEGAPLPDGDNSPEAFRNAILSKPFPVWEFHLHNNNGAADQHHCLEDGTLDMAGLAVVLKELDLPAVVTLEVVPAWTGEAAEANRAAEQELWSHVNHDFYLPAYTGGRDDARDVRVGQTIAYWKACLSRAGAKF